MVKHVNHTRCTLCQLHALTANDPQTLGSKINENSLQHKSVIMLKYLQSKVLFLMHKKWLADP